MATQIQFRRGTTNDHNSFVGASGEVTVDTDLNTIRVHDGATTGGTRIATFANLTETTHSFSDASSNTLVVTPGTSDVKFLGGTSLTSAVTGDTITFNLDNQITVNEISSTDSTGVTFKDDLLLAGTLRAEDSGTISVDGGMGISGAVAVGGAFTVDTVTTNVLTSSDSTGITVNDDLLLAGTLRAEDSATVSVDGGLGVTGAITATGTIGADTINVNVLQSSDSTGITLADDLLLAGSLRAEDSTTITIDGAVEASGVVTATGFTIGDAEIVEAELETIDGVTAGTVAASKAVVVDSNKDIASFRNVTATGSFIIGSASMDETDLEKIDGITNGTIAANKAVVVNADKDASEFRNLNASGTVTCGTLDVREILSSDSTNVVVNEGLEVLGLMQVNEISASDSADVVINDGLDILGTLQVNEITSSDSSEVVINNIRTQVITANDSTEVLVNDAMRVSGLLTATATSAQYADLAERYASDMAYEVGTVLVFGGSQEVTQSTISDDYRIAGVVSEKPAYLMNKDQEGPAVALKGKIQCKVVGPVNKGDLLVTSATAGHAMANNGANPNAVLGRSMVDDLLTHSRLVYIQV